MEFQNLTLVVSFSSLKVSLYSLAMLSSILPTTVWFGVLTGSLVLLVVCDIMLVKGASIFGDLDAFTTKMSDILLLQLSIQQLFLSNFACVIVKTS